MKIYTAKIHNADRAVGSIVNLAIVERIFDRENKPLADSIVGAVDCRIVEVGAHWSVSTRGDSGRWYAVEPLDVLCPCRADREILVGCV